MAGDTGDVLGLVIAQDPFPSTQPRERFPGP